MSSATICSTCNTNGRRGKGWEGWHLLKAVWLSQSGRAARQSTHLYPACVDIVGQDGRITALRALRQRCLLELIEHESLAIGTLCQVTSELLHLRIEAGLALRLKLGAQRRHARTAQTQAAHGRIELGYGLLEVHTLLRR
eukprot:scaffold137175_cov30-Tisochrysis_lutea.AAC.3